MSDVTRVSHDGFGNFVEPAPNTTTPPTAPAPTPAVQVNPDAGRTIRTTTREDGSTQADSVGVSRMSSAELFHSDANGILGTAKNSYGRPISGKEIKPDSIVTGPGGFTATVGSLVHAGLLRVDENGNYAEVSAADQAAANTPPPENIEQPEAFTAEADEAALAHLAANVRPEAVQEIVTAFVSGRALTPANLHDFGMQAGMSPEAFAQSLNSVLASFSTQAGESVKSLGLTDSDLPDFYAWAASHHAEAFKSAKLAHALQRSTAGYKSLANLWLRATPPSEAALRAAGYTLTKNGAGQTLVNISGVPMLLEVAAKNGMI